MAPTAPSNAHGQIFAPPPDNNPGQSSFSPLIHRPSLSLSSSPSFSSSSSSLTSLTPDENISNNSPISPSTPLQFSGQIPFSWEQIPGIPKAKQTSKKKSNDTSLISLLPLPPAAAAAGNTIQKKNYSTTSVSFRKDPFVAALVECSKGRTEEGNFSNFWKSSRVTRTLSDRLGFVSMFTSCKSTSIVSESIVFLPRSSHDIHNNNNITRRSR